VSVFSAYLGANHARQVQHARLERMIPTLSDAKFPLSEPVLRQMSDLSGVEFAFFDRGYRLQSGTLKLGIAEQKYLQQECFSGISNEKRDQTGILLKGRAYLSQCVEVKERPPITPGGWLIVLSPKENWARTLWQATYPALLVGTAAIVALIFLTTLLAHRFVEPIRRLGDRAAGIAEGNFEPLPVSRRNDEIRDLTLSINRMAEQLGRYENDIRRHEQLRTLGQLGAGLAHQLRNAATGGRMAIELHQLRCSAKENGEEQETLEVALRQLRLMESYLQRFLALGQTRDAPHKPLDLEALVNDSLDLIRTRASHAGIEIVVEKPPKSVTIAGDADALRQLFVNLLMNSIEAASGNDVEKRRIEVSLDAIDMKTVVVKFVDTGPGPASEIADRLFQPFVTGKPEGTGLGLYVARQTVESHQGKIDWSRENGMTCFTVEFPCLQ
jgi:signal transduction histidine kinase